MRCQAFTKLRVAFVLVVLIATVVVCWFFLFSGNPVRNVILVSIDTCRADHLSCYGFGRKTTPNIDAIARQSILFKNAFTPIPLTLPAHSSMLTGTYPTYHKVHDNLSQRLGESNVTIAEILRTRGYTTGAIVSTMVLDSRFGTDQGFDSYNDQFIEPVGRSDSIERRGGEASRFACSWLEEHHDEPFFLFLHYFDPHTEYSPPEPFATTYADDLYSGEIAYTDHCIAQVIDKLKSLELYDSTLIIIVGDHGEGLGEHGESEHGYYIYESMIKVPFIIRPPACRKPGKRDDIVSLVDVVPTVLGYLGIPIPAHIQGRDLSGYSTGKTPSDQKRYLYCESLIPTKYGCNPLLGLIDEQWKYIETTRPELYNLPRDPLEENNLLEKEAKRARFMRGQLQGFIAELSGSERASSRMELDEETRRRLESLGYVGGDVLDTSFKLDPTKRAPKELIQYHEYSHKVTYLIYYKRYSEARAVCDKMLAGWPEISNTHFALTRLAQTEGKMAEAIEHGNRYLDMAAKTTKDTGLIVKTHQFIGEAACQLEKFDLAIEHFTEALKLQFNWPEIYNGLASAFYKQGNFDEAISHWNTALRHRPNWPEVHNNLAGLFFKQGNINKAIKHWTEALRLKPDWPEVRDNLNKLVERKKRDEEIAQYVEMLQSNPDEPNIHNKLARVFYKLGKIDDAILHWSEAVRLSPNWAEARDSLATAFYRRGDIEKAIEHWTEAVRLKPDWAEVRNNLAWVLATIKDEELRNLPEAIELAERACELTDYNQPGMLDTLGVAYAAAGRFDEAVKTAEKARELAAASGQKKLIADIENHLELYKLGRPFRQ